MATAKEIIEQNKEQIIEWYLSGMSQRAIAAKINVGKSSVGKYLKDVWKIAPPPKVSALRKTLLENKEKIISMYLDEGLSAHEIGDKFNTSKTTILTYLKDFGVTIRPSAWDIQPLKKKMYGFLEPIEPIHENGLVKWKCKCHLCGVGYKNVVTNDLNNGKIIHCGCARESNGVLKIQQILRENNISFVKEFWFDDFRYESGIPIRFDFFVDNKYFIEFDGEQHFKNTGGYFTGEVYEERVHRDQLKNAYCLDQHYPLIRIPYTYEDKIDLKILTPTKDNPFLVDKIDFRKEFIDEI